jgi:hypothetical protein
MGSAGEQPYLLQKWRPPMRVLIADPNIAVESAIRVTQFRIPVPDSRLRVKVSIVFSFAAGQQPEDPTAVNLASGNAKLWLAETEDDESGATGQTFACTNIITGTTVATPLAIPVSSGLAGFSLEVETAADNIEGQFQSGSNGFAGSWVLQLRYQPSTGQRYTPEEWRQIIGLAKPIVPPAILLVD